MRIGLIGDGVQSKRIQKILKKKNINFFLYKPNRPNYFNLYEFEKVKKCNVIFILTPNRTHCDYIKKLKKGRYIFCEKPPASSLKELNNLKKINNKKIYYNYNYRFSIISEILEKKNKYKLGKLIYANIIVAHGLALKSNYKKNWRSDFKKCPKGVYELVSVHFLDLINFHFDIKVIKKPKLINHSGVGNSFDTSSVELMLKNRAFINISSTYSSPLSVRLFFLFDNGIVEQQDNKISVSGPAMNLDSKGFFKIPKTKKIVKIDEKTDHENSLKKSVNFFLNHVKKNKAFNRKLAKKSFESNFLILKKN